MSGTAFTSFDAAADYLYLGDEDKFDLVVFDIDTPGSLGDLTWQYWNGSAWTDTVPAFAELPGNEDEDPYDFSLDGGEILTYVPNWTKDSLGDTGVSGSPPDSTERYWIRIKADSVTASPTIKRVWKRAYNSYCTPQDVYNFLGLNFAGGAFTSSTKPSLDTVEELIHRREGYIDAITRKTWRPNLQVEFRQFNLDGIALQKKPAYKVFKVDIWNGTQFETRILGRDEEVYFVPEVNTIKFSRLFLLPARFTGVNRGYYGRGVGEFSHSVKVTYLYGYNQLIDEDEGPVVHELAVKLAAIDLLTNADYSKMMVSGTDRVNLQDKIQQWRLETEETLYRLKAWEIF